ncbi:sugar ABC transporter substrate-binding protein [Caldibacillus lycopersici]|uniref:Sugar ABC transporter substrate-binding protein n=1 Tax=Perspicuibacillus lycopersici TaxID=1325689 RepID=A0AAE3ITF3_9BACI|nr:sugar ABC transporter substrate-binding protein [Perspicuibacillus lycopersici]MCU9613129.1 sugar ABC transporter substrate-binding protein [Perspicuibacillus lycopersici]
MKKFMYLVIALLVSVFISACSNATGSNNSKNGDDSSVDIVYLTMDLGSPYFVEVANGVEEKAKELGWNFQVHDAKGDVSQQISGLENFIAQGVDAILISPLEENAAKSLIEKATDAGIKVINLNSPVDGSDVFITPDEYDMGYAIGKAAGQWAAENLEGPVKAVTYNVKEHPATLTREEGMRDGIKEFVPDVEFVASMSALTPEDGMANMEGLIQAHPDINIVVGCNDAGIMGSYEVAKSANLDLTKMYFGGIDAVSQAIDLIKSEKAAGEGAYRGTVDITPFKTGEIAVETAEKLLNGEEVEDKIIIPAKVVSWDNIDEY